MKNIVNSNGVQSVISLSDSQMMDRKHQAKRAEWKQARIEAKSRSRGVSSATSSGQKRGSQDTDVTESSIY